MYKPFNVNHNVKVKLTAEGRAELRRQHEVIQKEFPSIGDHIEKSVDEDGYTEFQMHDLISSLGHMCAMGSKLPFETEILLEQ